MAQKIITTFVPVTFDLGQAVSSALSAFGKSRQQIQTINDTKFYQAVNNGMSFKDQLAYRNTQLEMEKARDVTDPDYLASLEKEVAGLKQQARFEQIRTAYKTSLDRTNAGLESWQQHLDDLNQLLVQNPDPEIQTELRSEITTATREVYQSRIDLIDNEQKVGEQDKSVPLLTQALNDAQTEKAKALAAGDTARASAFDVKASAITQSITDINLTTKANAMLVNKSRKASSVGYLGDLNDQIAQADTTTPIVYQGVHYDSEQQFWTLERNKYVDTNFFNDLATEYQKFTKAQGDVNGMVPDAVLKNIQSDFEQLAAKPEMQPYLTRLQTVKSSTLSDAVALNANAIMSRFTVDDDYSSALRDLQHLKDTYGIDQTANANKIIVSAAQQRGKAVTGVITEAMNLVSQKGMTYEAAVNQVLGAVGTKIVAPNFSSQEIVNKTPGELAKEAPQTTKDQFAQNTPATGGGQPTPVQNDSQKSNLPATTPAESTGLTTTPSNQFNVNDYLGSRLSSVDNKSQEFFNRQSGKVYGKPLEVFQDFLGSRPSATNPAVKEYYNKTNNQAFQTEAQAVDFANSLGVAKIGAIKDTGV